MAYMTVFTRSLLLRSALVAITLGALTACGGGGDVGVGVAVVVPAPQPAVLPLALNLSRVGPEVIGLDWSDDPAAATFLVVRNGSALTSVNATSLDDASVFVNQTYCYQVQGYNARGLLISASSTGCITLVP